ncbi:hypothetical protein QJ850_gp232 [Acanthamoeba polyphaga mimivirus]|uniref:Uncharacterized protein n=1 Tax=Acanthamoeba polyphaga mimivirus Kroon TaxID=3069720 RepID=A0A0G2Y9D1_9VIRU|nr:hypothetical protein QJ850_gp232 [Acanthamoeba polyphaga mimivirus]AKI80467.1 hypothetical protein [Acanthamoeba polyphaga mimivirus Kroon]
MNNMDYDPRSMGSYGPNYNNFNPNFGKIRRHKNTSHPGYNGFDPSDGPMNGPMGGPMNGQMGGPMGGPMNGQMGGPMGGPMNGPMNGQMGGPMNGPMNGQMGGPMNGPMNGPMGGPMNGPMGGPMNGPRGRQMNGPMNGPNNGPMDGSMNGQYNGPMNGPNEYYDPEDSDGSDYSDSNPNDFDSDDDDIDLSYFQKRQYNKPTYHRFEVTDEYLADYLLRKFGLDKEKVVRSIQKNKKDEFKAMILDYFYKENPKIKHQSINNQYKLFRKWNKSGLKIKIDDLEIYYENKVKPHMH